VSPRAFAAALLATLVALVSCAGPALAGGSSHLSLPQVQQDFMCTVCHEPLNEARSDEAYQENGILRQLIAQGDGLPQIKRVMVSQYGPGVLADPPAHGFNLFAYIIPGVVIALGVATIAITIPRWRRGATRRQTAHPSDSAASALSDEDAQRLDADLARQA
jgi:cytochrome c-type biogenesis protein CcmH/NrfF